MEAQIQNIWGREYRDATWLENTINFPDDRSIISRCSTVSMQVTSAKRLSLYASGSPFRSTVWISAPAERKAIYPCNRIRKNETDNELEPAGTIPRSCYPHRGGLSWLATRAQSRLHGQLLDESLTCSARKSRAVASSVRSFEASWKPFKCAQRIVNRLRARVEIVNRCGPISPEYL
jgi:hypothetical protein